VLRLEFPGLAARLNLHLPDEKSRRVGQAVAAASLPPSGRRRIKPAKDFTKAVKHMDIKLRKPGHEIFVPDGTPLPGAISGQRAWPWPPIPTTSRSWLSTAS